MKKYILSGLLVCTLFFSLISHAGAESISTQSPVASVGILVPKGGEVYSNRDLVQVVYVSNKLTSKAIVRLTSFYHGDVYSRPLNNVSNGKNIVTIPLVAAVEEKDKYRIGICDEGNVSQDVKFKPLCTYSNYFTVNVVNASSSPSLSSTISNVSIAKEPVPIVLDKYRYTTIVWQGTNLSRVDIDLYDSEGKNLIKGIVRDYKVLSDSDKEKFSFSDWLPGGFVQQIPDGVYTIKVTDSLNRYVTALSPKITIKLYQAPTIATVESVGSSTLKLVSVDGKEAALNAQFLVKITATTDSVFMYQDFSWLEAKKVSPADGVNEYSSMYGFAKSEPVSGDFISMSDSKGGLKYKISKGKSAVFKVTGNFDTLKMFAGQYKVHISHVYVTTGQDKWAYATVSDFWTNSVSIVGEKSPYIKSVTRSVKVNQQVVIEGVRFSSVANILKINDEKYTLPGVKDGKISFIPSKIGLAPGQYNFRITTQDGSYGESNYMFMEIREDGASANILGAAWSLITSVFGF